MSGLPDVKITGVRPKALTEQDYRDVLNTGRDHPGFEPRVYPARAATLSEHIDRNRRWEQYLAAEAQPIKPRSLFGFGGPW